MRRRRRRGQLKSHNASEGELTLGAKNLYELIDNLPGDEISLKKADNHWAEIKSGKVTYRIVGMPDRDFPKVPDHREANYATIERSGIASAVDESAAGASVVVEPSGSAVAVRHGRSWRSRGCPGRGLPA